ncbi:RING-H2 finger protein ATL13-like [Andrographis paniculata]|uniref:RING-H2 finger protein ATL13-like n=1 Tax=Andrographis paniculata TaxID=175694 RepID=UPI0021E8A8E0|nr:RING-H2 finger protein ATL13-like [Andrographis paniculata]
MYLYIMDSMRERRFVSPTQQQQQQQQQAYSELPSPPLVVVPSSSSSSSGFNLNNKVSPSILLIIIILAIIFFISGVLHLLVRFLLRAPRRDPDEMDNVTALQGQLQQLFNLHDAGVDQSFIDALPVFDYKAIIGVKDPFDCAVCLCEFDAQDKLRLLPKCSHAFHMDCIDTWLLSHSTCPLCRATLLSSDFPPNTNSNSNCPPLLLVLQSAGDSSREIAAAAPEPGGGGGGLLGRTNSSARVNSHLSCEIVQTNFKEEEQKGEGGRVVSVKLGKFKNIDDGDGDGGGGGGGEASGASNDDVRRCFSMGSFAYVMDETSSLQVPIRTPLKKKKPSTAKKPTLPGHGPAMSECGCSRREFEAFRIQVDDNSIARSATKKESFSISKIWLRGKKEETDSSRRAFSFRNPGDTKTSTTEINWENNSLDSQPNAPSFARRTLQWLMGKPNKVVHSSFSANLIV